MIPFPRMMVYGNTPVDPKVRLNIDFSKQNVGDTNIVDFAGNRFSLAKGTAGSVIYDSTLGKNVYRFNNGYFTSQAINIGDRLDLTNISYQINMKYMFTALPPSVFKIFETGWYGDARVQGIAGCIYGSIPSCRFWMDNGNTTVLQGVGSVLTNQWEDVTITYRKGGGGTGCTLTNNRTAATINMNAQTFGKGNFMSIGGSYVNGTVGNANNHYLIGSIASLTITQI